MIGSLTTIGFVLVLSFFSIAIFLPLHAVFVLIFRCRSHHAATLATHSVSSEAVFETTSKELILLHKSQVDRPGYKSDIANNDHESDAEKWCEILYTLKKNWRSQVELVYPFTHRVHPRLRRYRLAKRWTVMIQRIDPVLCGDCRCIVFVWPS